MFNLQVTLSDFQCRKKQCHLTDPLVVIFRFGSIKLEIKLTPNEKTFLGGKKIALELSSDQLKNMFLQYALGMFIENEHGKFFCILSLEKLDLKDVVSGQEVYFYDGIQEIIYSAAFSLILNQFKNPRVPNQDKIQNNKTFNQFFTKSNVPSHIVAPIRTLKTFLYGNKNQSIQQPKRDSATSLSSKARPKSSKTNKNLGATSAHPAMKNNKSVRQQVANFKKIIQECNFDDRNQDLSKYDNPPIIQFTNTVTDETKGADLLKAQLTDLYTTAPETIKLMAAYESRYDFLKTKQKDTRNTIIKIQDKFNQYQNLNQQYFKSSKGSIQSQIINKEQLRNKAKKQLQNYEGSTNIKIPILKDGKYELVSLANLKQQQIINFAKKQKDIQLEEQRKKTVQMELQLKQQENLLLKKQLEEKQKLLLKQQQQAKKQKLQLLQAKKQTLEMKKITEYKKAQQNSIKSESLYLEENNSEENESKKVSRKSEEVEDYYESDFQSISMGSIRKKSRNSINSKQEQSEGYISSYSHDFESYSQSQSQN